MMISFQDIDFFILDTFCPHILYVSVIPLSFSTDPENLRSSKKVISTPVKYAHPPATGKLNKPEWSKFLISV